jgi:hypothetical protein
LTTHIEANEIGSINGDRRYESMNYHALSSGPLEFPMMGWPYYVRNFTRDLAFNDLYTPKQQIMPQKKLQIYLLYDSSTLPLKKYGY